VAEQLALAYPEPLRARVALVLDGGPLLVREAWACLGVTEGPATAEVAEALLEMERDGAVRWDEETTRWETR